MASAEQSILFPVFSQLHTAPQVVHAQECDIPDDRIDCSEDESDRIDMQDFLPYHAEVLR